jgi:glycosyltransferase involved in cell wall biosynthesis
MKFSPLKENNNLFLNVKENCCNTLIIDLSNRFGGANTRVLSLMQKLDRDRIALAALENSPVAIEAERAGLRVFIVGKNKLSFQIIAKLIKIIRREKIQVLDTQNPQSKFWGTIAAKIMGIALVSTLNSWYASEHGETSFKGRLYSMLELKTNIALDRYIAVSTSICDALVRHGIDSHRIDLIHNAVEINDSQRLINQKFSLESLNLPPEAIILVAAGRLAWAKGYADLISALEIIIKEDSRIYCLIAGDGELYESLDAQIKKVGLAEHILLLGYLPRKEVLSLIKASNIFVMPSRSEGTPIALLEAAALCRPILATSVGGIPELLENGKECLLVPPLDPLELAKGIQNLVADKLLSNRLAENAYRRVLRDFNVNTQALATIQSYNKAWQSRKERSLSTS